MVESNVLKALAAPVRRYFNPRFEALNADLGRIQQEISAMTTVLSHGAPSVNGASHASERAIQADFLDRVDVSAHNHESGPAGFESLQCRAANGSECDHPRYLDWWRLFDDLPSDALPDARVGGSSAYHRKYWEWAFIAQSVQQSGLMQPGKTAAGFGVGNEVLPALFASRGMDVLATDQGIGDTSAEWAATGQLMDGLSGLSRPHLIADEALARRVSTRSVDMNAVPDDLGLFDVVWSSCVIEHLGSPARGLEFILESCELLRPGGIAVHTTELELTVREETVDYGHCAVYRLQDLQAFAERVKRAGLEASFNYYVSLDTPRDRWISLVKLPDNRLPDQAHLRLVIGDSVSTSYGIVIRKPETKSDPAQSSEE